MPCRYYTDKELLQESNAELAKEKQHVNLLTNLLCLACKTLEEHEVMERLAPGDGYGGLLSWWRKHKALDVKRDRQKSYKIAQLKSKIEAIQAEINLLKED